MSFRPRRPLAPAALLFVVLSAAVPSPSFADGISNAKITVNAKPAGADVRYELTWTADRARSAVVVYLAGEVRVTGATVAGSAVSAKPKKVPDTRLNAWKLPAKLGAGESVPVTLQATVAPARSDGIFVGESGGALLPGSGWFPMASPTADALTGSAVRFTLPEGWTGIAAGERQADGWSAGDRGRPYAVWGSYGSSSMAAEGPDGSTVFTVWKRAGGEASPDVDQIARLIGALDVGLGEPAGTGGWKIVEVDELAGGQRTLFWDGRRVPSQGDVATLRGRDVAGALAAAYWTESVEFRGDLAAFLSRSLALQLGDIALSALAGEEGRLGLEEVTIHGRRSGFVDRASDDRPLQGLSAVAEGSAQLLAGRGALVAHMIADDYLSRARWLVTLRGFREAHHDKAANAQAFSEVLLPSTVEAIEPFLKTTDVPDFVILSHGPVETKRAGTRYGVEVENRGKVGAAVEVATFDSANHLIYSVRVRLEPGEARGMKFADPGPVARVEVDPRGVVPQVALDDERFDFEALRPDENAQRVPSFAFRQEPFGARAARNLDLELAGVSITGFNGWVLPYSTHHGPSGACLLGTGTLTLKPGGAAAASWQAAMGRESLVFEGAREMWVRFPVESWAQVAGQLGELAPAEKRQDLIHRQNWVYQFSFPTCFYDQSRAQLPPPGGSEVVFRAGGGEWRGFSRVPQADGVHVRFWDHLASETLWEDNR